MRREGLIKLNIWHELMELAKIAAYFTLFDMFYPIKVTASGINFSYSSFHGITTGRGWLNWTLKDQSLIVITHDNEDVIFKDSDAAIQYIEQKLKSRFK
jgi:hypothetical protein